jgi:hypothetical protein
MPDVPAGKNTLQILMKDVVTVRRSLVLLFCVLTAASAFAQDARYLFSDDFESYAIGSPPGLPWIKSGDGKVIVDSKRSFSGKKSVHFVSGETYRNRAILTFASSEVFPLKKNRYYGQMEMYVEEASPDGVHWTMLESSGKVPGKDVVASIRYGGQHDKRLMANYDTVGAKSDCWQHSSVKIPEGRWFRINWFFDGPRNIMKLWIDDKQITEITVKGRGQGCLENDLNGEWLFPIFEDVQIGWVDYQPNGGERNVWIDDFAISETPFGKRAE